MANWKSKRSVSWVQDHGMAYSNNENSWMYGTVSDVLIVQTKVGEFSDFEHHPATEKIAHYQQNEALALLEILIDWAEAYHGPSVVAEILERRSK